MAKESNLHFVGQRSAGGQTLGSTVGPATLTLKGAKSIYLLPIGGGMAVRRVSDDAAEDMEWPEDVPFSPEGFRESMGQSEQIPDLVFDIPVGTTLVGFVEAAFAPEVT